MDLYKVDNDNTAKVFWAYSTLLIKKYQSEELKFDTGIPLPQGDSKEDAIKPVERVAVIGAGVSGLRVAMKLGADYKVDVFEAAGHVGGRLYTSSRGAHANLYAPQDVGAMRFPCTSVMKTTYQLFRELDIPLLEYRMNTKESFLYYNGIRRQQSDAQGEDFGARQARGGNVPDEWADQGYDRLMENVYARWLHRLRTDFNDALEYLVEHYDKHSTRSLMAFVEFPEVIDNETGQVVFPAKKLYPTTVINWLETMTFSAGWFDRAFVETILEMYAFAEGLPDTKWRCVKHGSERITDAMRERLETDETFKENVNIYLRHQVTSVVFNKASGELTISGKHRTKPDLPDFDSFVKAGYSHVVLAVSPQVMRFIDLSTCELDYTQKSALLMLSPGPSTKVGIKFKTNWWKEKFGINGGQSKTDRPVRTVVYPSHGDGQSTVLIASYCWTQDALSMGGLMQGEASFDNERLKNAILRDLADVHGVGLSFLEDQFQSMYGFDWTHNPKTMGAYAFFGPGQFSTLYKSMTRCAADGRLHFAGEAVSTCHAWVAGALESAERVVGQIDPSYLTSQPATAEGVPHGGAVEDFPILLPKDLLLKQLGISNYLQRSNS
ncbi:Flavin containing amine oxidoreductase, partial [Rhizoctonia solani]